MREQLLNRLLGPRTRPPMHARAAMLVEEFEPRVLHSADLAPALLHDVATVPQAETRVLDASGEFAADATQNQQSQRELVIVDTQTPDYQKLVDDIRAQAGDGRSIDVVLLDSQKDGITQITDILASRHDISAVHIISHGSDGAVQLGSTVLDLQSLASRATDIASWSNALTADADLLIYGCDVAAAASGQSMVDALARLTGADVAASENLTGYAAAGGDWNLEYATGHIETASAIDAQTQQAWTGLLANTAPTLSGSENLATIPEDASPNTGTQVATLIAGHVTDPDAGAVNGIAVTAVDNANGTWQYSINAGGTWNAFSSPSNTNATLLRSSDFVRFVPNADWNGTVTNGLTFRAWDQTGGTAGSTADTTVTLSTVRDEFASASFGNNDGTVAWKTNWVDDDGSPSSGAVQITGGQMQLQTLLGGGFANRQADLSSASSATLTFDYDNQILLSLGGNIALQISNDGGSNFTTLATFSSGSNTGTGTFSADISAFMSGNTEIQFVSSGLTLVQSLFIDNLQVAYVPASFSGATASSSITVTAANDPPAGANHTVTTIEDGSYTFGVADFGFSDTHDTPANNFLAVTVTTLPGAGSLTLNGAALTAGQSVSVADIVAGKLQFAPAADGNGAGYASFTFQVQDDGGGADLDPTARTMTIDVTAVNDPPAGTNNTVTAPEDGTHVFTTADFGFTDPADSPANNLLAVRISSIPGAGSLTLSGTAVVAGQFVSATDVSAGNLVFTPAADANGSGYASFTFQVQDDGGGADLDPTARTMTIDVSAVNDAPVLATNTGVTVSEGASVTITTASLRATDVDNSATQLVFNVTTGPANGRLELTSAAGVAVTSFTEDDIDNNRLVYVHDGSQSTSDAFSFNVSDGAGGSTATTAFAISVSAVDDAPVNGVPGAQSTAHNTGLQFSAARGNAITVSDADAGAAAIQVTLSATHGTLTLASTAGLVFSTGTGTADASLQFSGTVAAINAALNGMTFNPTAGYTGAAAISLTTDDLGNTGSGGPLTASSSIAIDVLATPPVAPTAPGVTPPPSTLPPETAAPPAPPVVVSPVEAAPVADVPTGGGMVEPAESATQVDIGPLSAHAASTSLNSGSTRIARFTTVTYSLPAAQWLMFGDETTVDVSGGSASSIGLGGIGDGRSALQSPALIDALDRLRDGLQEQSRTEALVVATTAAASLGLSVGYVLWLLRGGVLISSMLSSLPAWRLVDPLPVLGRLDEDDEDDEDDSLESLVAQTNSAAEAHAGPDLVSNPDATVRGNTGAPR